MIEATEFNYLRSFLRDNAAIILDADKHFLAESRLAPLLVQEGYDSVQELLQNVRRQPQGNLHRKILEAMTNNETWFFRDLAPFEALRTQILPDLIAQRKAEARMTIWSAACSSGQEIYSIAILIREHFPELLRWDLRLLATDISARILERAREGRYSQLEVNRGLPARLMAKYFAQKGGEWELSPDIRKMVTLRPINLSAPWKETSPTDIAFLRNVMIYFEHETRRRILAQMRGVLRADGYLILGCSESILNLNGSFEQQQIRGTSWYRPC